MNRGRLELLKKRARQLMNGLRKLEDHIELQDTEQRQKLRSHIESLADLFTFLINLEIYLEINSGLDGDNSTTA